MTFIYYGRPYFPEQQIWRASDSRFSYIVSKEDGENIYMVSRKPLGARPFDGKRLDLGEFHSLTEAQRACMVHQ